MGEYIPTTVKFGGKLRAEFVPTLIVLLNDKSFESEEDGSEPELANLNHTFRAEEVNYGQIEEITSFCEAHNLDYHHWCDAAGGGDPTIDRRVDGEARQADASEGEPMFAYSELLKTENMLDGFAKLIREARWWCRDLVLEIVP